MSVKGSPSSLFENVTLVCISGIIGVGKSTAIRLLQENPNLILQHLDSSKSEDSVSLCFVKEPSELWRQRQWTTRFYENPQKRALAFQLLVFTTHVAAVRETVEAAKRLQPHPQKIICIIERSMWDQLLFWKVQGVDSMEDDAYMQTWTLWNEFLPPVSKIFFCKTSNLSATMARVQLRASMIEEEKEGVSLEYQTLLYEKHCEWYTEGKTNISWTQEGKTYTEKGIDCVHLNTDLPYHEDEDVLKELACELAEELKEYI